MRLCLFERTADLEESDIPVEIETSAEDSSVSPSESVENDGGDIDPKSDDGLAIRNY